MLDAFADILLVLFVSQCRSHVAHRVEVIGLHVCLVHCLDDCLNISLTIL